MTVKITRTLFLLAIALLFSQLALAQQTVQLFLEDFNSGGYYFTLNSSGPDSAAGSNKWIVNKQYAGNGIYPNTTSEHNTLGGTITKPDSDYLHIYNSLDSGLVSNCNYNDSIASDNFAYSWGGFCTLGYTNVHFTFFYIAEGDTDNFGEVYYSLDNGQWTKCGEAKYNNQSQWKYEDISLPVFANHRSVRFGFRWANTANGGTNKMSFGVDDIIAAGDFNTNPVTITVVSASPNPVCQESNIILKYKLSQPLCDGSYQVYMSNSSGSFNAPTNLTGFTIYAGDTSDAIYVTVPFAASGNCYKFRIDRTSPPVITGIPSSMCVQINHCPNTITTLKPTVLYGPDTLCDNSVMDVQFYSTGTFNSNNKYIAQLSDVNGSFNNNPLQIGSINDPNNHDPAAGYSFGTVSGLVPVTPPGCNYFIRVISTSPSFTPASANYYGPFCIRQCDIKTNNEQDIHICIDDTAKGTDTTISFQVHSWNNKVQYTPGNKFIVQVLDINKYEVVNTGGLGAVVSTSGTAINLHIPGLDSLENVLYLYPLPYYLRFISTNSNSATDTLGTLVRLTIGYANPVKPVLVSYDDNFNFDSVFCAGGLTYIDVFPFGNFLSRYQWKSKFNFGYAQPFYFDPPLGISLATTTKPGRYWFITREDSYGCLSDWSDTLWVTILDKPNDTITATSPICLGDTVAFSVPFQDDTYYSWSISGNTNYVIDTFNNQISAVFDSSGTYKVNVSAINQCASASASQNVTISFVDSVVTEISGTLTTVYSPATYQWIDCSNNQPVTGATSQSFRPSKNGNYRVIITSLPGCTATSKCVDVIDAGVNKISGDEFSLYPNPAGQSVEIKYISSLISGVLVITDLSGRKIDTEILNDSGNLNLSLTDFPAGAYYVELVKDERKLAVKKFIIIK